MSWSMISFPGGYDSPDCRWIRTIFQHLYEAAVASEYDELALYTSRPQGDGVTLYLSPRATSRLTAAVSRFNLILCRRPATEDVELLLGSPCARRTDWCESLPLERWAAEMDLHMAGSTEAERAQWLP